MTGNVDVGSDEYESDDMEIENSEKILDEKSGILCNNYF